MAILPALWSLFECTMDPFFKQAADMTYLLAAIRYDPEQKGARLASLDVCEHSLPRHAEGLPGGMYFCRLTAGDFAETRNLVLEK